ncbi:MAG: hypothetical protein MJ014_00595 [Methanocorpusculum sp.]|nr:hypothetical protein [Methanocorpusculum sp.]
MLVVLLLACVLMAGAVSAGDQTLTKDSEFNFIKGEYATISEAGWYRLNATGAGNISITAASGNVILNSTNGVKLTGNITISGSADVTIDGMDILVNRATLYDDGKRVSAIQVTHNTPGNIVLQNSIITFDSSVEGKKGDVIASLSAMNGLKVVNNKFWNVPGHALRVHGLQDGQSMEICGNTVTLNPDEDVSVPTVIEPQGTGRALIKVWQDDTTYGVTYTVNDNVVKSLNSSRNVTIMRIDKPTHMPEKITLTMINNTLDDSLSSPYLYGGSIYAYQLGTLYLNVSHSDPTPVLVPGLNQSDDLWIDDATQTPASVTTKTASATTTKAPAPVAGLLFGLLAAGVLLRRRE